MPYVALPDGVPLYVEEHGEGPVVVLVPGWTITTAFWRRQVAGLAQDHRVVTLDLRGAGRSGKTPDGHTLQGYADDLGHVLDALDLRDVTLVGFAMAASVCALHLVADGARVSRLVWVDHSPCFFTGPDWSLGLFGDFGPRQLDATLHGLRHDRIAVTEGMLDLMFSPREDWMLPELLQTPTEVAVTMLHAVATADLRPLLPRIRQPVLSVNGERSAVPAAVGAWLAAAVPDGRSVVLPGAGHAPFWDDPDGFDAAVRGFVAGS